MCSSYRTNIRKPTRRSGPLGGASADLTYRRFDPAEDDALVAFLTADTRPFHGTAVVDADHVRRRLADGSFDGDDTRTFWITDGDDDLGLVRLMDLGDSTPVFDLRIRTRYRGRGIGGHAVLRRDGLKGTTTLPVRDDEPARAGPGGRRAGAGAVF
ncbi:hypothetical protein [Streptomyces yangpuensis]|uniref:hypothetical protein n=1 Tax=Streptomyces yangpuensis TaxID=1648182 RepID=UPI00381194D5